MTWHEQAACSGHPDPDQWIVGTDRAVAVCATCAVRRDCLKAAMALGEKMGVWGGLRPHERVTMGAVLRGSCDQVDEMVAAARRAQVRTQADALAQIARAERR